MIVAPELLARAATDLASIDAALHAAHLTVAAPTQAVLPAAADEVSAGIAQLFSGYGQEYQKIADTASAYQQQFVQRLASAAGSYASAEAINAALLLPASASAIAAAIPSLDDISGALVQLFFDILAGLYYLGFFLLIPIYAALALYLPFAFLGSLFPGFGLPF